MGIAVRVVPQGLNSMAQDFEQYNIGIIPVLGYSDMENRYRQSGNGYSICSWPRLPCRGLPAVAVIALLIKRDSAGPIFYKSKRYGRRGNIFHMY